MSSRKKTWEVEPEMRGRKIPASLLIILMVLAVLVVGLWLAFRFFFQPVSSLAGFWKKQGVEKPNVLLITLDTTRADHLPLYGYNGVQTPHLNELGQRGAVFEQCATASPLTLPAHCSILTGYYPPYHGVRVNGNNALSEAQTTAAEIFAAAGYKTAAFIAAFVLDGRWGLKQGFDYYDDQFDLKKYKQLDLGTVQRPGNEVVDSALRWLEENRGQPFFAWVHLYDPHLPYEPPEPYLSQYRYYPPVSLYDGEIAFMDEQIGRLYFWLKSRELDQKTVIVLVGDHGEGLGDHGELAHGYFIYDYAVHVPLIVVSPHRKLQGVRVPSQVSVVDLLPTMAGLAGLKSPTSQGRSLLRLMFGKKEKEIPAYSESLSPNLHYGWSPLLALRTSGFKFIDAPRPELYDLKNDPKELNDVQNRYPELGLSLKRELDSLIEKISLGAPEPQAANLDSETVERLAALGYIGASVRMKTRPARELADPKDKLEVYELIQQAGDLINHEEYEQAAGNLEKSLAQEPGIPQARLLLATCYIELGRRAEAKHILDEILREDPNSVQALISLANILLEEGRADDVVALGEKALSIDNRNTQAYTLIGEVYMARMEHEKARPYLEKAVEIQPKMTRNVLNLAVCLIGLKEYERAEQLLRQVLQDYPKFPLTYFHLGLLYEEQGRVGEALEAYAREIEYYPDHFRARFNLGKLLLGQGNLEGYLEQMEKVMKAAPAEAEGYLFLARGKLLRRDDPTEILELVKAGLSRARTPELKALGYFLLADAYNRLGQPARVQEALALANQYKNQKEESKR
ncbi:MAG: sulfatase-like hydrolase/transferase [Candidatus Saccharicenans sp.]|nr:sulfatase-like hydrolase/transferase [Candidatus Saccharicenans sp.]